MSLNALRHGLRQAERQARRHGFDEGAAIEYRFDPEFATDDELAELERILARSGHGEGEPATSTRLSPRQRSRLEGILVALDVRREAGEKPWTPPVTRDLVEATQEARSRGGVVLPVADRVPPVVLAFDPHAPDEPEPFDVLPSEPALAIPQGNRYTEAETHAEEPQAEEESAAADSGAAEPPPEPEPELDPHIAELLERQATERETERDRRQAKAERTRRPRPEPSEAAGILEMEF